MAWRPTQYLLDGELNNTHHNPPGRVTGWMRFVGMKEKVTFDLKGNFHRDIRGAKICFKGDGDLTTDEQEATQYLKDFATMQTGNVGDITAGKEPADYTNYPYIEWFSDQNGRVVIELAPDQVEVIGTPIPAIESDPISRKQQQRLMGNFLSGISRDLDVPVMTVCESFGVTSDPSFTHWVIESGQIVGEAHSVKSVDEQMSFAYVKLYSMPEMAEYGHIANTKLLAKLP